MHHEILLQIATAIVVATLFALIARALRQPVILGYVAAGILLGETEGLGWISGTEIAPISELGLILLLFMIGLEIDLKKLRRAGKALVSAGIGQFAICVALGLGFFPLIGFSFAGGSLAPLYLAVASALSSTMIVVKLLYDKFELDTAPGRVTLGILVFQDIWAILFLALQPNLRDPAPTVLLFSLAKGAAVVAFALAVSRYILPRLFRSIAKVPELMVLGALAWCFGVVLISEGLGLSKEMGALIAGVALSTFPYNLDVIAKVISLRDFFITLFFVSLGTKIPRPTTDVLGAAVAGSLFLMASRFLSVTPILAALRSGSRLAFVPALNLAQISEFSLVICTLGVGLGHLDDRALSVVVFMLVITSVASTYMILKNHEIYTTLAPLLRRVGIRDTDEDRDPTGSHAIARPIMFLGFARVASSVLHEILELASTHAERITVVDFNPHVRDELIHRRVHAIYGDVSHADTLQHANIHEARVVISSVPDSILKGTSNERLLRQVLALAPHAQVIVTSDVLDDARHLYQEGAAFVFVPRYMSARQLADAIVAAAAGHIEQHREAALEELAGRVEVLP
jgi:Kef-type K+ transport system membrane component KefB